MWRNKFNVWNRKWETEKVKLEIKKRSWVQVKMPTIEMINEEKKNAREEKCKYLFFYISSLRIFRK